MARINNFWETRLERPIVPPEPEEDGWPVCPICGAETDTIYFDNDQNIVGCGECIKTVDAFDWEATRQ